MSQHFYPSFFTPIGKGSSVADSTSSAWWAPADKTPLDYEEPAVVWACAFSFGHGVDLSTWKGKREEGRKGGREEDPQSSVVEIWSIWVACVAPLLYIFTWQRIFPATSKFEVVFQSYMAAGNGGCIWLIFDGICRESSVDPRFIYIYIYWVTSFGPVG